MKNKKSGAVNRAKKKHAKNVARKNKGAEYGSAVKSFKKIRQLKQQDYNMVQGIGTGISELNSPSQEHTEFVDDPVSKLNDTVAKANSTAKEITIS